VNGAENEPQESANPDQPSERLTIPELAEWATQRMGHEVKETQVRTASKSFPAFTDGGSYKELIKGTKFEITYFTPEAIGAWVAHLRAKGSSGVQRAPSGGGLLYRVKIKPEQLDAAVAALEPLGLTLERAFKVKAASGNGTAPEPASNAPEASPDDAQIGIDQLFPDQPVNA
jgi:hypothetical protein